jgi:molybdate transport system regulatory protein
MEVQIRNRVWLETEGSKFMGKGHLQLLKAIEKTGSLSKASKETGISYRKTWRLINQINSLSNNEVVHLQKGGAGGGGATVTDYGKKLLSFFENVLLESQRVLDTQLKEHPGLWD